MTLSPRRPAALALGAVLVTGLVLAGCASTGSRHGHGAPQSSADAAAARVERAMTTTTVLDAHRPTVTQVEARLALGTTGAGGLTPAEAEQLRSFGRDFVRLGRGNIVFSVPSGSANAGAAQQIVAEAQRVLFAEGVDYARMGGGAYQATGQQVAPVMVAFLRFEARAADCPPWTEIDPRKTASNLNQPRFGCAQAANLAAMIVDPGDLTGDRRDVPGDNTTQLRGIQQMRENALPSASGSVGGN
jgi:pilus assembly protein CpaD